MICKKINFRRELLGQPACRGHSKATEAKVQVGPLTARLVADLSIVHVMLVLRHREHRDNELWRFLMRFQSKVLGGKAKIPANYLPLEGCSLKLCR